jgi:hypothetical protein
MLMIGLKTLYDDFCVCLRSIMILKISVPFYSVDLTSRKS